MSMRRNETIIACVAMVAALIFLVCVIIALEVNHIQDTKAKQACVTAGKSYHDDHSGNLVCQ